VLGGFAAHGSRRFLSRVVPEPPRMISAEHRGLPCRVEEMPLPHGEADLGRQMRAVELLPVAPALLEGADGRGIPFEEAPLVPQDGQLTTIRADWKLSHPTALKWSRSNGNGSAQAVNQPGFGPCWARGTKELSSHHVDTVWYRRFSGAAGAPRAGERFSLHPP
jgi:hypothetical protein